MRNQVGTPRSSAYIAETSHIRPILAVWPFPIAELVAMLLITCLPALNRMVPTWLGF